MKTIGITAKIANPKAVELSSKIAVWLQDKGIDCFGDEELASRVELINESPKGSFADAVEAVICLGGDGTMLYAARLLGGRHVPMLGVNMGGLGFMTAPIKAEGIFAHLENIINDNIETQQRMMLDVNVTRAGKVIARERALNDAIIKTTAGRLIKLRASINKEYVTTYRADGLIIATPTGSTAYSLSAAGPILYPTIHSVILVPICPFNLAHRPVVLSDDMDVEVTVCPDHNEVELTIDGQFEMPLEAGDVIDVRRSESCVYLIKCNGRSYFEVLRERLLWEDKDD
jgi:NAD+ kinase